MISLKVEGKCQNCPYFSPDLSVTDITTLGDRGKKLMQEVTCKNKDFCNNLEEHLKNT